MNEGGGARLFQNWKSDPVVLNHFFEAVVANFKKFEGKKTSLQIYKSHALYKQAVQGDCTGGIPADGVNTKEGKKWKYWDSLRGMSQDMAKRRYCVLKYSSTLRIFNLIITLFS
jgi:acyl-CoA-binding protein